MQTFTTAEKATQLMATIKDNSQKYGWWKSELNSLGVNMLWQVGGVQALENLTDDVKQNFIHEYKTRYSEE